MSYVRSRGPLFGLDKEYFAGIDVHIHVPEGAIPKDGPSAGIAITTSIVSAITKIPVKKTQKEWSKSGFVQKYGCVVLEVQDYIDGINHPEWGRLNRQIFGPGDGTYHLEASYKFSTV